MPLLAAGADNLSISGWISMEAKGLGEIRTIHSTGMRDQSQNVYHHEDRDGIGNGGACNYMYIW